MSTFLAIVAFGSDQSLAKPATPPTDAASPDTTTESQKKYSFEKKGAIVYRRFTDCEVKLDVYQPQNDAAMPAIVMIHGGAWRHGSKIAMLRHARRVARVGYVVISIDYRLAPRYPWPAQLEDCQYAVKWIRHHADEYNIDASRIGVFGYSAGGHLAAMLGTMDDADVEKFEKTSVRGEDPVKQKSSRVSAVAAGGAPCDFKWLDEDSLALNYWLGGSRAELPKKYADASPLNYVTPDDAPFFLFHGSDDWLVPIETAQDFSDALSDSGVETHLRSVKGLGHFATFSKADLLKEIIPFFDRHLKNAPPSTRRLEKKISE